jgi:hypothetical protein
MSSRCSQPGCGKWAFEAGLCRSHHNQQLAGASDPSAANPFSSLVHAENFLPRNPIDPRPSEVAPNCAKKYAPVAPGTLKFPAELLSLVKQRGMTLQSMMQGMPECAYMGEFDMMLRELMFREPPVNVHELIRVKDPAAFTDFFRGPSKDVFSKWLVLFDLNEKILNSTQTGDRFPAEHYVPPVVAVLMQKDSPLFIISKCLDILTELHNAGESALRHMCKIPALPQFLTRLVDQLLIDEEARNAVGACAMMADACIALFSNLVIKCCAQQSPQVYCSEVPHCFDIFERNLLCFSPVLPIQRFSTCRLCSPCASVY